jgi:protein-S-isoprenylcysteine O-methyltransferase Ste14
VSEMLIHERLVWLMVALAVLTFALLQVMTAPYGRHQRSGWGPTIPNRLGWIVMESPAVVFFAWLFWIGEHRAEIVPQALLALWMLHYIQRTAVFPFRIHSRGKRMVLSIAVTAFAFNMLNAYVNARWISHLGEYSSNWLGDPRFLVGAALFLAGWLINVQSDTILIRLRAPGESGYKIPRGGLYRWISCPNYFGEILEWIGWALATWSTAGFAFALYTVANLLPRARAHHRWYLERFEDYPSDRKALIPFVL